MKSSLKKKRLLPPPKSDLSSSDKYKLLSDFMDNIPDAVFFKDLEGRCVLANKAFGQTVGLKPHELVGKTAYDFFPKEQANVITHDDQYVFETGRPIIDKIEQRTHKKGGDYFVSVSKVPRYDAQGRLAGLIGVARDVTRRVQFDHLREEKALLEKKLEVAEDLSRVKSEFISTVSHELRTPLAIIQQLLILIYDETTGPVNDQQREILVRIRSNMDRLKNIIDELLDISRIEGKKFTLRYSVVNILKLLKDSEDFFKQVAAEKNIVLSYDLPKGPINLFIDADRVSQVISNLVMNAIKFTRPRGRVTVEVKMLEYKVRIGVVDNGIGIPKFDLPRVFDKFVQVSPAHGDQRKGIGLGLSIAKELVDQQGGDIWAESSAGKGSKFFFTLPRYYTANVLSKALCTRINQLLERQKSVYLINLMVINHQEFKKKVGIAFGRFFIDLKKIIVASFDEVFPQVKGNHVFISDMRNGRLSMIFPESEKQKIVDFCDLITRRTKGYFIEHKVEDVFIALGILSYPSNSKAVNISAAPANLIIKELYIGAEMRVAKRIVYKTSLELISPKEFRQFSETVDLSFRGLCFISQFPIKMDARVKVCFRLLKRNQSLTLWGRVAWQKKLDRLPGDPLERYKMGLEFQRLSSVDMKALEEELKLYYE